MNQQNQNYPPNQPPKWEPPIYQSQQNPNTKVYCVLAYLGILWLVGLLADRYNPVTRFHVNQGIILTILGAVLGVVSGIWHAIFNAIFGVWFWDEWVGLLWPGRIINSVFSSVVGIILLVYLIIGISNAVRGLQKPLPVIGKIFTILR